MDSGQRKAKLSQEDGLEQNNRPILQAALRAKVEKHQGQELHEHRGPPNTQRPLRLWAEE